MRTDRVATTFDDHRGRLMGSAADGADLPDLVVTGPPDWLPGPIGAGVAAPLDGLVDDATLRDVASIVLEAFSSGGALFGLPVEITGVALVHCRAQEIAADGLGVALERADGRRVFARALEPRDRARGGAHTLGDDVLGQACTRSGGDGATWYSVSSTS